VPRLTYQAVRDYLEARYGADWFRAPDLLRQLIAVGRLELKTAKDVFDIYY
jgi:hypothetical protein